MPKQKTGNLNQFESEGIHASEVEEEDDDYEESKPPRRQNPWSVLDSPDRYNLNDTTVRKLARIKVRKSLRPWNLGGEDLIFDRGELHGNIELMYALQQYPDQQEEITTMFKESVKRYGDRFVWGFMKKLEKKGKKGEEKEEDEEEEDDNRVFYSTGYEVLSKAEESFEHVLNMRLQKPDGIPWPYPCKRCGKKSVAMYSTQARAADESATVILQCTECSYKWRTQ